jgi:putative NADPH-quinone reductase
MRVLYLYCHPCPESFHAALRDRALESLDAAGHEVDLLDLYAEGFEPVLGAEERRRYHDLARNREGLEASISRLQRAEGLIVQFPTWCYGPPAMLKGWLDRLILPGIAFDLADPARVRPMLRHIRALAGIVTYGRPRHAAWWMGDPPRKLVTRYLRWFVAGDARVRYHALYHMNVAGHADRRAFLDRVTRAMAAF